MVKTDPAAVRTAKAHIDAWSHQDWETAKKALAEGVHVTVDTLQPVMGPVDTTGIDEYMVGLHGFAEPITPGSAKIHAATGDEHNAIVLVTVEYRGPMGLVPLTGARLYQIDDDGKIRAEKVMFYMEGL